MAEFDRTKFLTEVTGIDVKWWQDRYRRLMYPPVTIIDETPILRYEGVGRVIAIESPDERFLEIDPEGPIKLDVELPSCGKVDPSYRLVIQSIGGCDVGMGYERRWGFR